jgi:hypothetical protein
MKNTIRKILKEEVDNRKEKLEKYVIKTLKDEGFDIKTPYNKIITFINKNFGFSGLDAFELYQLFKDNYFKDEYDELVRTDVTKKRVSTSNKTGRDLVMAKIPFKGSNTHAEYKYGTYVVYSYDWYPIFVNKDGQWFENENRYSMSTAKQMSQLRPMGQGEIIKVSKQKLLDLVFGK